MTLHVIFPYKSNITLKRDDSAALRLDATLSVAKKMFPFRRYQPTGCRCGGSQPSRLTRCRPFSQPPTWSLVVFQEVTLQSPAVRQCRHADMLPEPDKLHPWFLSVVPFSRITHWVCRVLSSLMKSRLPPQRVSRDARRRGA